MNEQLTTPPAPMPKRTGGALGGSFAIPGRSPLQKGLVVYGGIVAVLFVASLVAIGMMALFSPGLFSSKGGPPAKSEVAQSPTPLAQAAPASSPPSTVRPANASKEDVVADDVPDSLFNSASGAAERHAKSYVDTLKILYDTDDASFYSVEKTKNVNGTTIPNEYTAVVYIKTKTNAFGTHKRITYNLFYKYKPDSKQLILVQQREIDRGFEK